MKRTLLFLATILSAQITTPTAGYLVDRDGALRPILGLPGAFTLGPIVRRDVVTADYSGKTLVVKLSDAILVNGGHFEAPSGPAIVTFDQRGDVGEIRFPDVGRCWGPSFDEIACSGWDGPEVQEGELKVKGVPVRLSAHANRVSRMADEWLIVYADDRAFAVRGEQIFELPEASE